MEESKLIETRTGGEDIFSGVILNVKKDSILLPDGRPGFREYIRHNGAVGIVALTDDGRVCIERQYRYPISEVITDIPAGKLDTPDEDRLEAAKRELREETGFTADSWEFIGTYYPAAAYTSEKITLYLATGLHSGAQDLDDGEFLNFEFIPFENLLADVMADKVPDGKTQAAVLKVWKRLYCD